MSPLAKELRELEVQVMSGAGAGHADAIADFMSDDFVEIGSSGHKYSKNDVLEALPKLPRRKFSLEEFQVRELAPDLAMITYKASAVSKSGVAWAYRTSLWTRRAGKWQIVFHQATPASE